VVVELVVLSSTVNNAVILLWSCYFQRADNICSGMVISRQGRPERSTLDFSGGRASFYLGVFTADKLSNILLMSSTK
jgi:hypothetical protein